MGCLLKPQAWRMVSNHLATTHEGKVRITQLVADWLLGTVIKEEVWTLACGCGRH